VKTIGQREALLAIGWVIFIASVVWIGTRPVTFSI
jgi:hypothetical protein